MKLPVLPPSQTTTQTGNNTKYPDFILVAEFCEQRGPVTLFTVPDKRTQFEHFDFDSFSRRILSSDHTRKVDPKGCNSGWFSPDDTMVYLRDTAQRAHAYVHHVTLHDVEARGYVRPLCLCYVTQEESKIMHNFDRFMECFNQVSNMMKYGNNCVYLCDIEQKLTQFKEILVDISTEDLEETMKELRIFKQQYFNLIKSENIAEEQSNLDSFELDEDLLQRFVANSLSNDRFTLPKEFLSLLESGLNGSVETLKVHLPCLLRQIHKSSGYDKALRLIPEIVHPLYDTIIDLARNCLCHFSRPTHIIERELDDIGENDFSNIEDLLFIGGSFILDFSLRSYDKVSPPNNTHSTVSANSGTNTSSLTRSFSTPSNHDLSLQSLGKSPMLQDEILDSSFDECHFSIPDHASHQSSPHTSQTVGNSVSSSPLLMNYRGYGSYISHVFASPSAYPVHILNPSVQKLGSLPIEKQGILPASRSKSLLSEMIRPTMTSSSTNVLQLLEHYSFAKDLVYSIMIGVPVIICGKQDNEVPVRNFVNTLKLFVPGLMPNDTTCISHWRTTPISIVELSKLKLIGISKKVSLSKAIEMFVSKVDLEEQTFYGPPYKGEILDKIFSLTKMWPDERTLVSYIHTLLLDWGSKASLHYHLDSIASVRSFFSPRVVPLHPRHSESSSSSSALSRLSQFVSPHRTNSVTSLKSQKKRRRKDIGLSIPSSPRSTSQKAQFLPMSATTLNMHDLERIKDHSKSILTGMGITKRCDIEIIEYLGEVVKQQQRLCFEAAADTVPKCSLRLSTHERIKIPNTLQRRSRRVSVATRKIAT